MVSISKQISHMMYDDDDDDTSLEEQLARSIQRQIDAAAEEQILRQLIRSRGHVEPDSFLILPCDAIRRTMTYLTPNEVARSEVCKRIQQANQQLWNNLVVKFSCHHIDATNSKLKVLMFRRLGGRASVVLGRNIRIMGSPFATIPSKSGLNRSSSPSFSTTYRHMHTTN